MITQLRRKLKSKTARSVILWIILITLSLGLLLTLIMSLFKLDAGPKGSTTVNGKEISYVNLRMKAQENDQRIQMFRQYFGKEADSFLKKMGMPSDSRLAALQMVIQNELLNQLANKLNLSLSTDFIQKRLADKEFLQKEFALINFEQVIDPALGLNTDALIYFLKRIGLTIVGFEDLALKAMKRDVIIDIAKNSTYIPEFEVRQKYIKDYLARKYSILKFDFDSLLKKNKKKEISKESLQNFYNVENSGKKRYWVPQKRSGLAYFFDANSYGIDATEDEIRAYYDDNKIKLFVKNPTKIQVRRILFKVDDQQDSQKVLEKANKINKDLMLEPSSFANVAKEVSDDKESAKNGGLLKIFSRGQMDRELEKAAFMLKDDGDISKVIKTEDGYEIIQREKREDAQYKPLTKVKGEIRETVLLRKFKRLFSKDMSKLLSQNSFTDKKFDKFVKKAVKKEAISMQPAGNTDQLKALFRIRKNIPAYFIDGNKGVVVKLDKIEKRYLPVLKDIESVVKNDYHEKQASKELDNLIIKVSKEAVNKPIADLDKMYNNTYKVSVEDTSWIKQNDTQKVNELRSKGYPVEKLFGLDNVGFADHYRGSSQDLADGYVVKLVQIEDFNDKEYQENKKEIKKELFREKNMAQLEEFIAFLRKKAKIKTNR